MAHSEPIWLDEDTLVAMAILSVKQFGGFSAQVREHTLLRAAIDRPLNKWAYDNPRPNLYQLAAAYCFAFARGHVFHDGNKRTAYLASIVFLALNKIECAPPGDEIVSQMYSIARGELSENEIAVWLEKNSSNELNA